MGRKEVLEEEEEEEAEMGMEDGGKVMEHLGKMAQDCDKMGAQ